MSDTTDWTELREFKDVSLLQSFVLSWEITGDTLIVDLDLCLLPEHPFFEEPRPAQGVCVRPAKLEFPHCSGATADAISRNAPSVQVAIERFESGMIGGFQRVGEGVYELRGQFGTVEIQAERPILRLQAISE